MKSATRFGPFQRDVQVRVGAGDVHVVPELAAQFANPPDRLLRGSASLRAMPTFSHMTWPSSRCSSTAVFFPFTASSFLIFAARLGLAPFELGVVGRRAPGFCVGEPVA